MNRNGSTTPPGQFRVVRVIARLNVGGPAQHVVNLSAHTRRYPTLLVSGTVPPEEGDMSALADHDGVSSLRVPELGRQIRVLGDLVAFWKLYRLFRKYRPDIVHTHTAKAGTVGRLAAFIAGVPVRVHTYHGHVFKGYFSRRTTAIFVAIERLMARLTTRLVAISESQARDIGGYLHLQPQRIATIPLGLDLHRFTNVDVASERFRFRQSLGLADAKIVSMVGRLVPIKNHAMAIRAWRSVVDQCDNAHLVIVGRGEEEASLKQLAEALGLTEKTHFVGWRSDLAAVYYGSDVVALSSRNEGTPACLIEAMACGRSIVATDVGGVSDVLEGGRWGELVPSDDQAAFADAILRALHADPCPEMEQKRRDVVLSRFSVDRLVRDIESLYDQLVV